MAKNSPTYRNSLFFNGPLLLYSTANFVEHSDIKRTTTTKIFKNKLKKVILDCRLSRGRRKHRMEVDNFALYKCKGLRDGSTKRNAFKIEKIFLRFYCYFMS